MGGVDEKELVWHAHTIVLVDFFYQSLAMTAHDFTANQVKVANSLDLIQKTRNAVAHPRYTGSNSISIDLALLHTLKVIATMNEDVLLVNSSNKEFSHWYTSYVG